MPSTGRDVVKKDRISVVLVTFIVTAVASTAFWQFAYLSMATSIATGDVGDVFTRAWVRPEVVDDQGQKMDYVSIDEWLAQSRSKYGELLSYKASPVERVGVRYRVDVEVRWEKGVQHVRLFALPGNSFTHVTELKDAPSNSAGDK